MEGRTYRQIMEGVVGDWNLLTDKCMEIIVNLAAERDALKSKIFSLEVETRKFDTINRIFAS